MVSNVFVSDVMKFRQFINYQRKEIQGRWPGQRSHYSESLRAGRSGVSNPGGGEIFRAA